MKSPLAQKRSYFHKEHGLVREDSYAWLQNKSDDAVIKHLQQENSYCEYQMQHTKELRKKLYDEMLDRIQENDTSVPYQKGDWW